MDCNNVFRIERERCPHPQVNVTNFYYQGYDGHANNLRHYEWGKVNTPLLRMIPVDNQRLNGDLPNPRVISNALCYQESPTPNSRRLSDLFWAWGQLLDHEIDLTPATENEHANIIAPPDDPVSPGAVIEFTRSIHEGTEQTNTISSYIDSTNVYGYSSERASKLRLNDGSGKLKTQLSDNGQVIPPNNDFGIDMACLSHQTPDQMLACGDVRANENILLMSMHSLFIREHNRLCDEYVQRYPQWLGNDDKIYNEARKRLIGIQQSITYNEFLPLLLGRIPRYTRYNSRLDASVANVFSTVAYRVGHTMLSSNLELTEGGSVPLRNAFFIPSYIRTNGIESLLGGAMNNIMQEIDTHVVEDVRSFLFGPTLLDLASLNIQRGRDHGIPDYNTCRVALGLRRKTSFEQITSNADTVQKLQSVYSSVDDVDPWIGGLAEDHLSRSQVGEFFHAILLDQFMRLRDGDRYWFENDPTLSLAEKNTINNTRLGDVIKRNTSLPNVRRSVFVVPS